MDLFSIATTIFLIMDPFGNFPVINYLLKNYNDKEKSNILLRELLIAFIIIVLFIIFGKTIMTFLAIKEESISIAGGIILFLIALKMIFPSNSPIFGENNELFIVPIAIPMIAGPSLLATLILFATNYGITKTFLASFIAWGLSLLILIILLKFKKLIPDKIFNAIEKLMGMILIILSIQMLLDGIKNYLHLF